MRFNRLHPNYQMWVNVFNVAIRQRKINEQAVVHHAKFDDINRVAYKDAALILLYEIINNSLKIETQDS